MKKENIQGQDLKEIVGGNIMEVKVLKPFKEGISNPIDLLKDFFNIK